MASSKVMASSTSGNSDLGSSIHSLASKSFGSMSMDDLLRNIYTDQQTAMDGDSNGCGGTKTVDEVWREMAVEGKIMEGGGGAGVGAAAPVEGFHAPPYEEMTLEDFLARAGAVREEDVRVSSVAGAFPVDPILSSSNPFQQQQQQEVESSLRGFGNGAEGVARGKRRAMQEPIDRVAQQRQRRMIKNRESAARSRERKQAYTSELESLVTQLEEENARLLRQQRDETKKRLKLLMGSIIPVEEKRRPPRVLRKTRSMNW